MNWILDSTERKNSFPFLVLQDQVCVAGEVIGSLAGKEVFKLRFSNYGDPGEADLSIIDLFNENSFDVLTITGSCFVEQFNLEIAKVLPDKMDKSILGLNVRLLGKTTRLRKAANLSQITDQGNSFEISLARDEVFKDVQLDIEYVLAQTIPQVDNLAFRAGSILATSKPIIFRCDEPDLPIGGEIDCKWQQFPDEINNALYYLAIQSVGNPKPTIYFNSSHKETKSIIDFRGSHGLKAKVRDALFSHITVDVWTELAHFAHENADSDDGETKSFVEKVRTTLMKKSSAFEGFFLSEHIERATVNDIKKYLQNAYKVATKEVNKLKALDVIQEDES